MADDPYRVEIPHKAKGVHSGVPLESADTSQYDCSDNPLFDYRKRLQGMNLNPAQMQAFEMLYLARITGGEM